MVFKSDRLKAAQDAVHLFDVAFWVALFLPLVLIAVTLLLSWNRRRTIVQLAIGAVFALILAKAVISRLQQQLVDAVQEQNRGAVRDALSAGVHDLEVLIVWSVIVGIVVAIAMYLLGRPAWFMRLLAAVKRGWESDPSVKVQRYVGARPAEFAWGGVGVGVIALWIAGISWLSFVIVAVLVAGWAGAGRVPAQEVPGGGRARSGHARRHHGARRPPGLRGALPVRHTGSAEGQVRRRPPRRRASRRPRGRRGGSTRRRGSRRRPSGSPP